MKKRAMEFSQDKHEHLLETVMSRIEAYRQQIRHYQVNPVTTSVDIRTDLKRHKSDHSKDPAETLRQILDDIEQHSLHVAHPFYMGLFTPRTFQVDLLADLIIAAYNPNLGSWNHAPYFVELEAWLIEELSQKFGHETGKGDGVFASGGAEGNIYAVLSALHSQFPEVGQEGLTSRSEDHVVYCSAESHHSIEKAVRIAGLGSHALVQLPVDTQLKMNLEALESRIKTDLSQGKSPLMIVGTAGTTGAGAIDDLASLADLAERYRVWLHIDAAYGGAIAFHPSYRRYLDGIERSDSITFDLHKWPAAPVGTSVFLVRKPGLLSRIFHTSPNYVPAPGGQTPDPYSHSLQWSRRAIGFRFYLTLALKGWTHYEKLIDSTIEIGQYLRQCAEESGWQVVNSTPLPIICLTHPLLENRNERVKWIRREVIQSRRAWISTYRVGSQKVLRICITNYLTTRKDVKVLLNLLDELLQKKASL